MSNPAPTPEVKRRLRRGWTTGATAAAAAGAAFAALITGRFPPRAGVTLPGGQSPTFDIVSRHLADGVARVGIIKDAGDDPDVTHGLEVLSEVRAAAEGSGITFSAGPGVGRVTLKGLALAVGEAAINPGPRQQIRETLERVARELGQALPLNLAIRISIPGGEAVAAKTQNPRLGILGGLSVLGTTGIVVPYSCASWIHAIHRGVDVARELHLHHLLAATGRTSEAGANAILQLPEQAIIDMGDFAGGLFKYLRAHPVRHLTVAGGFGKLSKLAAGAMDLHSDRSHVNFEVMAGLVEACGGDSEQIAAVQKAPSAGYALQAVGALAPGLAHRVARQAREVALATLAGGTEVDVWVFDREGRRIATSHQAVSEPGPGIAGGKTP